MFRILTSLFLSCLLFFSSCTPAWAFCGFYVAKADTNLYNQASQVIIARDGNRTVLTMANDYQGDVEDFAMVVPVPVLLEEGQVQVSDPTIMARLDDFSAPRLVEYFDENPCNVVRYRRGGALESSAPTMAANQAMEDTDLGVTVESRFTVGEYDIVILSAKESDGLETWLTQNNYNIPEGASSLLQPYIRQQMKFFVAKVNLGEYEASDFQSLRPLMIAYESPKFMLPIRLGMINAQGDQDLIVYLLSPKGQIELTNYRTVKVPSDVEIPEFVEEEFADFYKDMFQTSYEKERKQVAFLEYAWDMAWCDPCSAQPLNPEELRKAGVFWLNQSSTNPNLSRALNSNVFISRLHVRYNRENFPEDLSFQETSNRQQFQGRYVIRHPFRGEADCSAAREYQRNLAQRLDKEAQTLARLTRWDIDEIRSKIEMPEVAEQPWWRNFFNWVF